MRAAGESGFGRYGPVVRRAGGGRFCLVIATSDFILLAMTMWRRGAIFVELDHITCC